MMLVKKIKSKIASIIKAATFSPIKYWEERAKKYGELAVLNVSLSESEISSLKDFQKETIFPFLKQQLTGTEQTLLDYGCGPGRLCAELADFTNCKVTGADPIEHLLTLAPKHSLVSYKKIVNNTIDAPNGSFDAIWICFVLGGIVKNDDLKNTVKELTRLAKPGALLFFVENTSETPDILHWKYHSKKTYLHLFPGFSVKHLHDFNHANEQFSIFAGNKIAHEI